MQGHHRRWTRLPILLLLGWIALFAVEAAAVSAPSVVGPWQVCDGPPWEPPTTCSATPLFDVDPQGRMLWLTADVRFDSAASEPVAVFISAYASSAVYWDGTLIGMNGVPSAQPRLERPGLRDAALPLPGGQTGRHTLTLRMSSHNGVVPLRSPVTQISVAPYERPSSRVMRDYLPALISAGGLAIMVLIFAFVSWGGRQQASRACLFAAALFATAQLCAEASRAFLAYPYPIHFLRIGLVLAFAAGFAFTLLAYLARRFEVAKIWPVLAAQGLATSTAIVTVPSYDQKTGLVLASAMAIGMLLAIRGAMRAAPGALPVVAMLALGLTVSLAQPYSFLDRDLYLWTAALFVLLFVGEARRLKNAPVAAESSLATGAPPAAMPAGLYAGTASDRRFLLPADIVRVAAADDYSELFLVDGGSVLHPEPLQKLLERLPAEFLRVHRSHAINLSHLRSFRKGESSSVLLSDHSVAPVSRRRVATLIAVLDG